MNFLQILNGTDPRYLINEDTADYIETLKPSNWLGGYFLLQARDRSMNKAEWEKFLLELNIKAERGIKPATEDSKRAVIARLPQLYLDFVRF